MADAIPISARLAPRAGISATAFLPRIFGCFLAARISFAFLAFQDDPRLGAAAVLAIDFAFLFAAYMSAFGGISTSLRPYRTSTLVRWIALYLTAVGLSLFWTQADSPLIAAVYWAGMCADVATVLLLQAGSTGERVQSTMQGFVLGSLFVAAVAWTAPALSDLRIGSEEFMHPNVLGLEFALAFFLAQHFARTHRVYGLCAAFLAISLFRTLSKTSIVAFLIAETFYLFRNRELSLTIKIRIFALLFALLFAFSFLLLTYLNLYATQGDQASTLTGRTTIWLTSTAIALEHPWIGHGLYSFHSVIPAFGTFEPRHAHDEWIQQFFELGAAGVFLTAGLYTCLIRTALRTKHFQLGLLATTLAIFALFHGLTDTVNFDLSLPLWLFAVLALCVNAGDTTPTEVLA